MASTAVEEKEGMTSELVAVSNLEAMVVGRINVLEDVCCRQQCNREMRACRCSALISPITIHVLYVQVKE